MNEEIAEKIVNKLDTCEFGRCEKIISVDYDDNSNNALEEGKDKCYIHYLDQDLEENYLKIFPEDESERIEKVYNHLYDYNVDLEKRLSIPDIKCKGKYGSRFYVIEKVVNGCTLRDIIEQDESFTNTDIIRSIKRICSILRSIHDEGIVHLDIKPENIIICDDKEVFIIDFDNSNLIGNVIGGTKKWTPKYAAPEIRGGSEKYSEKNDVYSLGKTLNELIEKKGCISNLSLNLRGMLSNIIKRCTSDGLEERYTVDDFIMALTEFEMKQVIESHVRGWEKESNVSKAISIFKEKNEEALEKSNKKRKGSKIRKMVKEKCDPYIDIVALEICKKENLLSKGIENKWKEAMQYIDLAEDSKQEKICRKILGIKDNETPRFLIKGVNHRKIVFTDRGIYSIKASSSTSPFNDSNPGFVAYDQLICSANSTNKYNFRIITHTNDKEAAYTIYEFNCQGINTEDMRLLLKEIIEARESFYTRNDTVMYYKKQCEAAIECFPSGKQFDDNARMQSYVIEILNEEAGRICGKKVADIIYKRANYYARKNKEEEAKADYEKAAELGNEEAIRIINESMIN